MSSEQVNVRPVILIGHLESINDYPEELIVRPDILNVRPGILTRHLERLNWHSGASIIHPFKSIPHSGK